MNTQDQIKTALSTIIDPELNINIVDLGFIYHIKTKTKNNRLQSIHITMTLTTPGCPLGSHFVKTIQQTLSTSLSIDEESIVVEMVYDPPWIPEMMTEAAKAELGFD